MVNIFEYTDFKAYLQHYYEEKKSKNPHFSYELFTRKAGFNNRGFLFNIIKGNKNLAKAYCYKLSQALGHTKNEADYFENIVAFAQAKTDEDRDHFYQLAMQGKGATVTPALSLRKDQYEYYSQWYYSAVRAFIGLEPFEGNYQELGRRLSPAITASQAKKSIQLLHRLGLIAKGPDGIYCITEKKIRAGEEISQTARNRFHVECTELARNTIMDHCPDTHEISSLTLGISECTFEIIRTEVRQFKERIIQLANNDKRADRVYQCQLLLFPLTRLEPKKEKGN